MESFVTVAVYQSAAAAEVARGYLQRAGVQAFLMDDHTVNASGLWANALGGIKLQVSVVDEPAARELLDAVAAERKATSDGGPIVFPCSNCEMRLEFPGHRRGGVESCPHCGAFVDVPEQSETALLSATDDSAQQLVEVLSASTLATAPRRLPLALEISAVLSFTCLPHFINAIVGPNADYGGFHYSYADSWGLISSSLQTAIPMFLIIVLLGEDLKRFGLAYPRLIKDFGWGLVICVVIYMSTGILSSVVYEVLGHDPYTNSQQSMLDDFEAGLQIDNTVGDLVNDSTSESGLAVRTGWLAFIMCCVAFLANSIAEELCMRSYLVTRLNDLWHNRGYAVAVSALAFGSYHIYQGFISACLVCFEGVLFAACFLLLKRIWPVIIGHTLINLAITYAN